MKRYERVHYHLLIPAQNADLALLVVPLVEEVVEPFLRALHAAPHSFLLPQRQLSPRKVNRRSNYSLHCLYQVTPRPTFPRVVHYSPQGFDGEPLEGAHLLAEVLEERDVVLEPGGEGGKFPTSWAANVQGTGGSARRQNAVGHFRQFVCH